MKFKLKTGKYRRPGNDEQVIRAGDVFEPSEAELKAFVAFLEPVAEEIPGTIEVIVPEGNIIEQAKAIGAFLEGEVAEDELRKLLDPKVIEALEKAGIRSTMELATLASDPTALESIPGIGKAKARKIRQVLMAMDETPTNEGERAEEPPLPPSEDASPEGETKQAD